MEKINREITEIKTKDENVGFAKAIGKYICEKCESDQDYRARVDLPEKTLTECIQYILTTIKSRSKESRAAVATDEEVFKIVDAYYNSSSKDIVLDKSLRASVKEEKVSEDKDGSEKATKSKAKSKTVNEPTYAKVDAPPKVEVVKEKSMLTKKSETKHRDPAIDNQVSLFDIMG